MEDFKKEAQEIVSKMTLEEKAGMCSGKNCWQTKAVERLNLPSVLVTDGPHGLRKQVGSFDNLGIGESVPATCFPTSATTACSFDEELMEKIGKALGEECLKEGVSVILGPGVNIKRNPLCGRNFEYFSEDPYLAGKMGAAHIRGVQSMGIGTSLKHFAANNQEKLRMTISSTVNERTLRDIYLRPFEIAVKEAKPWTVMCSYNKVNGTYSSENRWLLTEVLRNEWGFEGLVVSDWGAVHDRSMGVAAGLDLEMPASLGINDRKIVETVNGNKEYFKENGNSDTLEESLNKCAGRVVELALKGTANLKEGYEFEKEEHHNLAVEALLKSAVLLKNEDNILPLNKADYLDGKKIGVIGEFFENPRYQGAGSSKINPIQIDSCMSFFEKENISFDYCKGYSVKEKSNAEVNSFASYINDAAKMAKDKDIVIIFAGLTEGYESEGFDRNTMDMPKGQVALINEICKVNNNVIVVLSGGSPINLSWFDNPKAILLTYLGGEGVGCATTKLLFGESNPSGKLAETWPLKLEDNPSYDNFPGNRLMVEYREGIFVGYRHYDTKNIPVRFPFGYGLSYSDFEYNNIKLTLNEIKDEQEKVILYNNFDKNVMDNSTITVEFSVKNTSNVDGYETALIFASHESDMVLLPKKELIAFKKVYLKAGEEKNVKVCVKVENLGFYNMEVNKRYVEAGEYKVLVGKNVNSIELEDSFNVILSNESYKDKEYHISKEACDYDRFFKEVVIKGNGPALRPFTMENNLSDTKSTFLGRLVCKVIRKKINKMSEKEEEQAGMMEAMVTEMPFFSLVTSSEGRLTPKMMEGILDMFNGHFFKGVFKVIKKK